MGDTYLHLNPMDLARIFQPLQCVEVTISRTVGDESRVHHVTVPSYIINLENGRISLEIHREEESLFSLFRPGRVVTIQTGRSDGLFSFKSKILHRHLVPAGLAIEIESPRIMASKERRRGPRIPIILPVVYRVVSFRERELNHLANKIGIGQSENLSKGGITLLTDLQLPVGMILLVELVLDDQKITLAGIVRRSQVRHKMENTYALGIQFLEPGLAHQELIERTISRNGEIFKGGLSL